MTTTYGPYRATVTNVHDGDTATLLMDAGFGISITYACRFYGINAPELDTQAGKDARTFLVGVMPVGTVVTVLSYGFDKYGGRFDGVITLADGTNINDLMVQSGNAVPYPT